MGVILIEDIDKFDGDAIKSFPTNVNSYYFFILNVDAGRYLDAANVPNTTAYSPSVTSSLLMMMTYSSLPNI